jgi:glyoxylase-like metal-dependent hydrolase (beta-lactamase superfamily II)
MRSVTEPVASPGVTRLRLPMPLGLGTVNTYLVRAGDWFVLVDTGPASARAALLRALDAAGCVPGNLPLVVLTHGDSDHCGNAQFLRRTFESQIALHPADQGMAEHGDMSAGRRRARLIFKLMVPLMLGLPRRDWFTPDVALAEGVDLGTHGWAARAIHTPGHSAGSVCLLAQSGELFCGDLFENRRHPRLNGLMDDPAAGAASLDKLLRLEAATVYPGHGEPFALAALKQGAAL